MSETDPIERAARNILIAAGRTWVTMDGEWDADVKRYREMCAVFPDFVDLQESPAGFDGNPLRAIANLKATSPERSTS